LIFSLVGSVRTQSNITTEEQCNQTIVMNLALSLVSQTALKLTFR